MERKNDSTILLLVAAGLGIYWFMKNKSMPPATTSAAVIPTSVPKTDVVYDPSKFGYNPNNQIDISAFDVINTQKAQDIVSTQPIYEQPVQEAVAIEYTPVTDMFNSVSTGGGIINKEVETINFIPQSALSDKYL